MIVFADTAGKVVSSIAGFTAPVEQSGSTFVFDETTNTALATDLQANQALYTIVAGTLRKSGVVQSITAPSATFTTLQSATPNLTEAQFETILGVLNSGSATLAQVNTILFNVLLRLRKAAII